MRTTEIAYIRVIKIGAVTLRRQIGCYEVTNEMANWLLSIKERLFYCHPERSEGSLKQEATRKIPEQGKLVQMNTYMEGDYHPPLRRGK